MKSRLESILKRMIPFLFLIGLTPGVVAQTKTVDYFVHLIVSVNSSGAVTKPPTLETAIAGSALDSLVNHAKIKVVLEKGNILDALNYFSQTGWKLISVTSVPYGLAHINSPGPDVKTKCYYLLKKEVSLE